jgi:hypothetical protein
MPTNASAWQRYRTNYDPADTYVSHYHGAATPTSLDGNLFYRDQANVCWIPLPNSGGVGAAEVWSTGQVGVPTNPRWTTSDRYLWVSYAGHWGWALKSAPGFTDTFTFIGFTATPTSSLYSPASGSSSYNRRPPLLFTANDPDGNAVDGCEIQIASDANFSSLLRSGGTSIGRYDPNWDMAPGRYYWRARTRSWINGWGAWSATSSFTVLQAASAPPPAARVRSVVSVPRIKGIKKRGRTITIYGTLSPRHSAGSNSVVLRIAYVKGRGWVTMDVAVPVVDSASGSSYSYRFKLPKKKRTWAFKAYAPLDADHLASTDNVKSLRSSPIVKVK